MSLTRRTLLTGLGSLLVASPAIVRASSLMPVRSYLKPGDWWLDVGGIRESYHGKTWRVYWSPENVVDRNWLSPPSELDRLACEDFATFGTTTIEMEHEPELRGVEYGCRVVLRSIGGIKP